MKRLLASFIFLMVAGCQAQEPVGYLTLTLPETETAGKYRPSAALATLAPADVKTWTVIVAAEDMDEPVIVEASITGDRTITIPVKAGADRIVHVAGRGAAEAGIVQGFDGETVVDVAAEGNTDVLVDVYRSVTVDDATAPMNRYGEETEGAAPDIRTMTLVLMPETVDLYTTFGGDVAAPWNAARDGAIVGTFEFDADANPRTGEMSRVQSRLARLYDAAGADLSETSSLGVDVAIDLVPTGEGTIRAAAGEEVTSVDANFSGRAMSISVPYSLFGEKPKVLRFAGFVSNRSGNTDFVPEKDYVEIALEEVEPVVLEPQATTAFVGMVVQDTGVVSYAPNPFLSVGVGGAVHLAWQLGNSVSYRYSEDGKVFSTLRSWSTAGVASRQLIGFDVTASKTSRQSGALVVTYQDSCSQTCITSTDVFLTDGGALGEAFNVSSGNYYTYQYLEDSKAIPFGSGILVAGSIPDYSTIVAGSGGLYYFAGGVLKSSKSPSLGSEYNLLGQILMPTDTGAKLIYYAQHNTTYTYAMISYDVTPSNGDFGIGASTVSPVSSLYFDAVDAVSLSGETLLALTSYSGLTVNSLDGTLITLPETYHQYSTDFGMPYPYSAARIASGPDGRVGVVWHEGPAGSGMVGAPAMVQLARVQSSDHAIWYAEKLPGADAFGPAVRVGSGLHADIAFDSQSRPIVSVGHVDYDIETDQLGYPIGPPIVHGSNVSIYRGN